jgi:hypothetical protein
MSLDPEHDNIFTKVCSVRQNSLATHSGTSGFYSDLSQVIQGCIRVQLNCDGTRGRTGGEVKGKLANGVGSQYSSHYLGTWCIQHYYP